MNMAHKVPPTTTLVVKKRPSIESSSAKRSKSETCDELYANEDVDLRQQCPSFESQFNSRFCCGQGNNPGPRGPIRPISDDHNIMVNCLNPNNKSVRIDGERRDIVFYDDICIAFMTWEDPREISFRSGSRKVIFDYKDSYILSFNKPHKDIRYNGHVHKVRLGVPTREICIDGQYYECHIGGPGIKVYLFGQAVNVKIEGPVPQVVIGAKRRTDIVAGKVNLIIDAKTIIPIYLDAKLQKFKLNENIHSLQFIDALQTVLIDGKPFNIQFGGFENLIFIKKIKKEYHFIRFSVLPRGIKPGCIKIRNMQGNLCFGNTSDLNSQAFSLPKKVSRVGDISSDRNSNSPNTTFQQPNLGNLDTLTSNVVAKTYVQPQNENNTCVYQNENNHLQNNTENDPSTFNINDPYQKLVDAGTFTIAQNEVATTNAQNSPNMEGNLCFGNTSDLNSQAFSLPKKVLRVGDISSDRNSNSPNTTFQQPNLGNLDTLTSNVVAKTYVQPQNENNTCVYQNENNHLQNNTENDPSTFNINDPYQKLVDAGTFTIAQNEVATTNAQNSPNMEGNLCFGNTSDLNSQAFSLPKKVLRVGDISSDRNSNSPNTTFQQPNLGNLDTLTSNVVAKTYVQPQNENNTCVYQNENNHLQNNTENDPSTFNINDLYQKLVAAGTFTIAQNEVATSNAQNSPKQPIIDSSRKINSSVVPLTTMITLPSTISTPLVTKAPINIDKPLMSHKNHSPTPSNISDIPSSNKVKKQETTLELVDFSKLPTLKVRQPNLIIAMYYVGIQCSSCDMRFPPKNRILYSQHLDWHFRQNRKRKMNIIRKGSSRMWYYAGSSDWYNSEEIEDLDEIAEKCYFKKQEKEQNGGSNEEVEIPSISADPNVPDARCEVCFEKFEQYYNEEKEEWHLRMAIRTENNLTYHPLCYEDYQKSLITSSLWLIRPEESKENGIHGLEVDLNNSKNKESVDSDIKISEEEKEVKDELSAENDDDDVILIEVQPETIILDEYEFQGNVDNDGILQEIIVKQEPEDFKLGDVKIKTEPNTSDDMIEDVD